MIAAFISYLDLSGYSPNTIISYISAINYFNKMLSDDEFLTKPIIKKMLVGLKKKGTKRRKRNGVDIKSLKRIYRAAKKYLKNHTDLLLFQTVAVIMLFGLFRVSELLSSWVTGPLGFNPCN